MKINKKDIFKYLEERTGSIAYIGLHGISENPDINTNFSNFTTEEKAENILKTGLLNNRQCSISRTCVIYGNLSNTYEEQKNLIISLNNYSAYDTQGTQFIVVVAIPIIFECSDKSMIFGGWMNPTTEYSTEFKCLTDKAFKFGIPKEMILGYYSYNPQDEEVEFIENKSYYSELSQPEKDIFIKRYIDKETDESYSFSGILKHQKDEYQNRVQRKKEKKHQYSLTELDQITIEHLDIENIDLNYDLIMKSKFSQITKRLIIDIACQYYRQLDENDKYYLNPWKYFQDTESFEKWISQRRR